MNCFSWCLFSLFTWQNLTQELSGIRILQFSSPLFFLNRDTFKKRVIKLTTGTKNASANGQDESAIKADGQLKFKTGNCIHNNKVKNGRSCNGSSDAHSLPGKWQQLDDEREEDEDINCSCNSISQRDKFPSEPVDLHRKSRFNGHSDESKSPLHTVIIDCTSMAFIDSAGVATLAEVCVRHCILSIPCILPRIHCICVHSSIPSFLQLSASLRPYTPHPCIPASLLPCIME